MAGIQMCLKEAKKCIRMQCASMAHPHSRIHCWILNSYLGEAARLRCTPTDIAVNS